MELNQAKAIADRVVSLLAPHCERIEIAGSIRRKKPEVGDIEIVCITKKIMHPRTAATIPVPGFIYAVSNLGIKRKGEAHTKYMQRFLPEPDGIMVDIFTAVPDNWGYIFAIRTGSADYSHRWLANGWVKHGYKGEDGFLTKGGEVVPVREEIDLFNLIKLPYCEPENRNV